MKNDQLVLIPQMASSTSLHGSRYKRSSKLQSEGTWRNPIVSKESLSLAELIARTKEEAMSLFGTTVNAGIDTKQPYTTPLNPEPAYSGHHTNVFCYPPPGPQQSYAPTAPAYNPTSFGGFGGFSSTPYFTTANVTVSCPTIEAFKDLELKVATLTSRVYELENKVNRHDKEIGNIDKSIEQLTMNEDDNDSDEEKEDGNSSNADTEVKAKGSEE